MNFATKALTVLRVLDDNGNISLTNAGVMAALGKIAVTAPVQPLDVASLAIAVGNYAYKKWAAVQSANASATAAHAQALAGAAAALAPATKVVDEVATAAPAVVKDVTAAAAVASDLAKVIK
jgi:hypothetical protein